MSIPTPLNPIARLDVDHRIVEAEILRDLKAATKRREREALLAEQRHQYLDLDDDSTAVVPGACHYSYLRTGGQS